MSLDTVTDADIEPYLDVINPGRHIRSIGHFADGVAELMLGKDPGGDKLPWPKTHQQFRMLPGEVTVWHGINGHGKSAVTTQVAAYLGLAGRKSCLASFEMAPARTVERMLKQVAGNKSPTADFFAKFFMTFTPLICIYDKRGRVDARHIAGAIRFCAAERGTSHFFVDSLMKCVRKEDDYNAQKDFMEDMTEVAAETGVHVHVIHHAKKAEDEKKTPGKFDAKGSGAITDLAHNVMAVWRNKAKDAAKESAALGKALEEETPDFVIVCDKQRTLGWEGRWALWGDLETWHFREQSRVPWTRGYELPAYNVQNEPGAEG